MTLIVINTTQFNCASIILLWHSVDTANHPLLHPRMQLRHPRIVTYYGLWIQQGSGRLMTSHGLGTLNVHRIHVCLLAMLSALTR